MPDLARARGIVQRTQRLLEGRRRIGEMQVVEVDVVGREAREAGVEPLSDGSAREASRIGLRTRFRREHEIVSAAGERLAKELLRGAGTVALGRVDEGHPELLRAIDDRLRTSFVDDPPELVRPKA